MEGQLYQFIFDFIISTEPFDATITFQSNTYMELIIK